MILVKSVLTGIVAAVFALVAWVVAQVLFALLGFEAVARSGAGGLGAVSGPISGTGGLIAMAVGFACGLYWMWRRSMRKAVVSRRT